LFGTVNEPLWSKSDISEIGLRRIVTFHFVLSGSYEYNASQHFSTSILTADVLAKSANEFPTLKMPEKASSSKKIEKLAKTSRKTKPASEEFCTTIRG
jgi:hypothetical protein